MSISYGVFRGLESVTIENGFTKAVLLKHRGGRMVSLINKKTGREYLTIGEGDKHAVNQYGDDFNWLSDLSGQDECFPTCDESVYPLFPWQDIVVPTHGEIWAIDWDFEQCGDELLMTARGVRFSYTFTKRVKLLDDGVLRVDYNILNRAPYDMHFIWLPHPLLCMEDDITITLPKGIDKIISLHSSSPVLGKGRVFDWPNVSPERDLSRSAEMEPGARDKFYSFGAYTDGRMAITYEQSGEGLALRYPADKLPYAGVWINNRGLRGMRHVALEPATGGRDNLEKSIAANESAVLPAKGIYEFYMEYELY